MSARLSVGVPDVLATPVTEVIKGTTGADTLVGTTSDTEVFNGFGGGDLFIGGPGDNLFRSGAGQDTYVGGPGFDRISFLFSAQAPHGVIASLLTQTIYDDGFGNTEHMSSIEGLGAGTLHADILIGDNHPNYLVGGAGDVLFGLGGDDVITVFGAPALVDGGSGVNTLYFAGQRQVAPPDGGTRIAIEDASHGISVDLSRDAIIDDGFGGSGIVLNIQNVYGSPFDDTIVGNGQDNVLMGLAGNDTMTGGGGADIFLFDNRSTDTQGDPLPNGRDVITDFQHGHDRIAINEPGVQGFGDLTITQQANGDVVITYGTADDQIVLMGVHQVTAQDFIFGPI